MKQRLANAILPLLGALAAAVCPGASPLFASDPQVSAGSTPIYAIQSAGPSSPFAGERIATLGWVTGVTSEGFYLQDPTGDGNPQTSDGIYVYTYAPPAVSTGQCVAVHGAYVQEFYGKTELSRVAEIATSAACTAQGPAPVDLPRLRLGDDPAGVFEPYEGMLVRLATLDAVVHGPAKQYASGELEIAWLDAALQPAVRGGRIFHTDSAAHAALQYLSNVLGADLPAANWGDRLLSVNDGQTPLTGILDYNFGKYQFLPLPGSLLHVEPGGVQAEVGLAASHHDFTVCTFNLHGLGRGAEQFPDPAAYDAEVARRARVIAETLAGCTLVALQETGSLTDARALAGHLAAEYSLPYEAIAPPGPSTYDPAYPLTNSFLVRSDRVELLAAANPQACTPKDYDVLRISDDPCPPGQYPLFDRPPLLIEAQISGAWGDAFPITLINNHWKSKAGDESVNAPRRLGQARHVAALLQERLAADPQAHVIVLGDFNDFFAGPPLAVLAQEPARLINALDYLAPGDRYTYIYNGASQALDHILLTPNMVQFLSGVDAVHSSADFASGGADLHEAGRQVSDHDPVAVRIRPEGAAAIAGNARFGGVVIGLATAVGPVRLAAVTDRRGDFRIWDVGPGAAALHYLPPAWIELEAPAIVLDLSSGVATARTANARHRSAIQAAHAAAYAPSVIAAQPP